MDGFLGCIDPHQSSATAMCAWMREWIGIPPEKALSEVSAGPFRYVASREGKGPAERLARTPEGTVVLYHGLVPADQFGAVCDVPPRDEAEVASALLALYQAGGPESLAGLNGRYVAVVWDAERQQLHLANDVLGLYPTFVWRRGGAIAFSSNVWAIARHPDFNGELDIQGIADFLTLSHQQGNRTLLREVSVLPAGSVVSFADGQVSERCVRDLVFSDERWDWGIDRIGDELHERLLASSRRQIPDDWTVRLPLTGGFDSRTTLGLLMGRGVRVQAVSQRQPGAYAKDTRLARRLARTAHIPHRTVPLPDDFLGRLRRRCVAISGGLFDISAARFLSLMEQSQDADVSATGTLGGEVTGRFMCPDGRHASAEDHWRSEFESVSVLRFSPDELGALLSDGVAGDLAQTVREESRSFFVDFEGRPFQQFLRWDLLVRRRRFVVFQPMQLQTFARSAMVFYDRDVIDLVCSLPLAALEEQRAYRAMICRHFPALARVPSTNDTPLSVSTRQVMADCAATQLRRFVVRPIDKVFGLRRWIGHPYVQFGFALSQGSQDVLDHLQRNAEKLGPYLRPDLVADYAQRQARGDNTHSMGVLALSTLATVQEMADDPDMALRAWRE